MQLRGDWSEFSHTFGFADWSSKDHCCFFCKANRSNRFTLEGFNPLRSPWEALQQTDIDAASSACEIWLDLSRADYDKVKALLAYDKRSGGPAGRALQADLPHLGLRKGDRLEPHSGVQNIGEGFDSAVVFPFRTLFWRRSQETWTRHRLPLLDPALGITIDSLMIDSLHTLYLGPTQVWVAFALWRLTRVDAFDVGHQQYNWPLAVLRIKNELWAYYKRVKTSKATIT